MSPTFTTRLGLRKPNVADNYDIDIHNDNSDDIDSKLPIFLCTSVTRPALPFHGMMILETDTGRLWLWNSTASAWYPVILGHKDTYVDFANGTNAPLKVSLLAAATLSGNRLIDARKLGDANVGWCMDFDGRMQWGVGGATAPDVNLYRDSADVLATDDAFFPKHASMQAQQLYDTNNRTTTSTTFTDTLATGSALAISIVTPPSGKLEIAVSCRSYPGVAGNVCQTSARISGAGTQASAYEKCISNSVVSTDRRGTSWIASGLTPGATATVTMQHTVSAGTGNFDFRALSVKPLLA